MLEERDGAYRFIHLALQEFLVARYLREVIGGESREAILAVLNNRLDDPWWREPILLLVGYMAINATRSARDFIGALARAGNQPNAQFSAAELAGYGGAGMARQRRADPGGVRPAHRGVVERFGGIGNIQANPAHPRGRYLGAIGRSALRCRALVSPAEPLFGFIEIPAGHFKMGATSGVTAGNDDELPQHEVILPGYYLARWPVTVAQFAAFVRDSGHKPADPDCLKGSRIIQWSTSLGTRRWLIAVG